jgi:hypothetical protein
LNPSSVVLHLLDTFSNPYSSAFIIPHIGGRVAFQPTIDTSSLPLSSAASMTAHTHLAGLPWYMRWCFEVVKIKQTWQVEKEGSNIKRSDNRAKHRQAQAQG